jgi:hypothetical protein
MNRLSSQPLNQLFSHQRNLPKFHLVVHLANHQDFQASNQLIYRQNNPVFLPVKFRQFNRWICLLRDRRSNRRFYHQDNLHGSQLVYRLLILQSSQ